MQPWTVHPGPRDAHPGHALVRRAMPLCRRRPAAGHAPRPPSDWDVAMNADRKTPGRFSMLTTRTASAPCWCPSSWLRPSRLRRSVRASSTATDAAQTEPVQPVPRGRPDPPRLYHQCPRPMAARGERLPVTPAAGRASAPAGRSAQRPPRPSRHSFLARSSRPSERSEEDAFAVRAGAVGDQLTLQMEAVTLVVLLRPPTPLGPPACRGLRRRWWCRSRARPPHVGGDGRPRAAPPRGARAGLAQQEGPASTLNSRARRRLLLRPRRRWRWPPCCTIAASPSIGGWYFIGHDAGAPSAPMSR